MSRFVKFQAGSDLFLSLISSGYHKEFALLSLMASRARRKDDPITGLKVGECFVGDLQSMGLTEKQYRTAKKNLEKFGLATFKGASKGTVGKLTGTTIYDINAEEEGEQKGEQGASEGRTGGEQGATNKNVKKEKNVKNGKKETPIPDDFAITDTMTAWAKEQGLTIDLFNATDRWKDAMIAKGRTYKDWTAAWRNGMKLAQNWDDQRRERVQVVGSGHGGPIQSNQPYRSAMPKPDQVRRKPTGTGGDA